MNNGQDFLKELNQSLDLAKQENVQAVATATLMLQQAVIMSTPVDEGTLRSNWMVGDDGTGYESSEDTSMANIGAAKSFLAQFVANYGAGNKPAYLTLYNDLPYAAVVEFGGYPDPVKYGTWDKAKGHYVIKSQGGFSLQAPEGMLRINSLKWDSFVQEALKMSKK